VAFPQTPRQPVQLSLPLGQLTLITQSGCMLPSAAARYKLAQLVQYLPLPVIGGYLSFVGEWGQASCRGCWSLRGAPCCHLSFVTCGPLPSTLVGVLGACL